MATDHLLLLMERSTHRNPQRLCLFTARNDAPIVIGEHYDRNANERWIKDSLAGAKEIIAVYEGETCHGFRPSSIVPVRKLE